MGPFAGARSRLRFPPRGCATLAAALAVALFAGGCAGRSGVAGGTAGAEAVDDVVLFPLNVVVPLPPGLEEAAPTVDAAIRAYLDAHDLRVQGPSFDAAQAAWLASAQALKADVGASQMSFEGAAAMLARRMHAQEPFDALVLPWIALRPAKVRGRTVSWDGVTRTLKVVNPEGRSLQVLRDFQAQAAAPSLQLTVFSPDGRKLFEGVGGLDLQHALVLEGDPTRIDAELLPRAQVFADRTPVAEGIAIAFDPFLPRP